MSGARLRRVALVGLVGLVACEDPEFERRSGVRVDYLWEPVLTPCGGTVDHADTLALHVAGQLGLDVGDLETIRYFWVRRDTFRDLFPSHDEALGVARWGDAYGWAPLLEHELVHAVVDQAADGGLSFLNEGLAVAFDPQRADKGPSTPRYTIADPRPLLTKSADEGGSDFYLVSGGFVASLLSKHGAAPLLELHGRLGRGASEARIRRVYADVYGRSIDDEVDEFLHDDVCPEGALPIPTPAACAAPTLPWEGDHWQDLRTLECDADDVAGGLDDDGIGTMRRAVTLEIPVTGRYVLRGLGDRGLEAWVLPCGACPWLARDLRADERPEVYTLEAGLHAVVYEAPADGLALGGVVLTPFVEDTP